MLQVQCEVMDQELEAFVDTGAQVTVMSLECAERCGLVPLIDQRFVGTAVGVGSTRIVGRINNIDLHIGDIVVQSCVTILEDMDLDMLLGMDVLRQGQCEICLRENVLRFRNGLCFTEVPFLTEDSRTPVVAHVSTEPRPSRNVEGSSSETSRHRRRGGVFGGHQWVNRPGQSDAKLSPREQDSGDGTEDDPPISLAGM